MTNGLSVEQKISQYIKDHPEVKNKSSDEIVSIMVKSGAITLTEAQKISVFSNGTVKGDSSELNSAERKGTEQNITFSGQDGKTHDLNELIADRIASTSANLQKAEDGNGFIAKGWNGFKNMTTIGDSSDKVKERLQEEQKLLNSFSSTANNKEKVFEELTGATFSQENFEKFMKGEIKLKSQSALEGYTQGQEMAVDITGDIVSGISAVGIYTAAVAAAPFSGGASIAAGVGAAAVSGAAIKSGIIFNIVY